MEPTKRETESAAEPQPPCAEFERTLALLDGVADPAGEAGALAHAAGCPVCGPLLEGWEAAGDLLRAQLEDAAERAKPDLALVADRVLERTHPQDARPVRRSAARRLAGMLPPWLALGAAAAALALVLGPLVQSTQQPADAGALAVTETAPGPNDLHMHKIAFDGADGMVYRTGGEGVTVIWIREHEGV